MTKKFINKQHSYWCTSYDAVYDKMWEFNRDCNTEYDQLNDKYMHFRVNSVVQNILITKTKHNIQTAVHEQNSSAVKSNQFQYFVKSTSNWPKTYSVTK